MSLQFFIVILSGVLAATFPGRLERVQAHRIEHSYGLTEAAPPGTVLLGVQDCRWLGRDVTLVVDRQGAFPARIVDCQQREHREREPMSGRGLVADVNEQRFDHSRAVVVVR